MPDTDRLRLAAWLPCLVQTIGTPDEELILIGHSLGTVDGEASCTQLPESLGAVEGHDDE